MKPNVNRKTKNQFKGCQIKTSKRLSECVMVNEKVIHYWASTYYSKQIWSLNQNYSNTLDRV